MFDPYHKWLGLPKSQRPPTFYQLLGVAPDESDADVIKEVALRQTSHVRTYQTGPHADECTRLLNEIAQARAVLLDPAARKKYDAQLASARESQARNLDEPSSSQDLATHAESGRGPILSRPGRVSGIGGYGRMPRSWSWVEWPLSGLPTMGSSDFMKATHRHVSVEVMCERLIRSHLFSPEEVKVLENRWHQESREPANLGQFSKWLVNDQYATEFQVVLLLHGHLNHFFLDHYKILERNAKGRLGVVYRAVHRLGHIVALKVLPPSRAKDPQLLARFQHQISLACGLEHPNVVRAHHAGEANGLSYLVMEYVDGENLQEVLVRRKRLLP